MKNQDAKEHSQLSPTKKASKEKNSNPYDNLHAIWQVLRDHASADHPLTAKEVYDILQNNPRYPSSRTTATLLEERANMMGELFGCNLVCSQDTVKNVLRTQAMSTELVADAPKIACVAKKGNKYTDYEDFCIAKAEEKNLDELPAKGKPTRYYYIESRLSDGEWRILTDLLLFSPWISPQQTEHFIETLHYYGSTNYVNAEVYYSFKRQHSNQLHLIHSLHQGITQRKKVVIRYGTHVLQLDRNQQLRPHLEERSGKAPMTLAPLTLLWANGQYYLVAQYKEDKIMHLRVDRILTVALTSESFDFPADFSSAKHRDTSPIMYGGLPQLVRFSCPTTLLSTVMDFFGAVPQYKQVGQRIEVSLSVAIEGVKLFALQYLETVEVLEPPELRREIGKVIQDNLNKYNDA